MKLSGTAQLSAPPDRVWEALNDPGVLARTIPGCQALTEVGPDEYTMTVCAGVASIKGTYLGKVRLADKHHPTSYVLHASGSGGPGTVSAECLVTLDPNGDETSLIYAADAVVGGVIAGVGQRVLAGVAKKMAAQFFTAVDAELRGVAPAARPGAAVQPVPPDGSDAVGATTVHSGRAVVAATADARSVLVGGVLGAAIALAGVWVGARLGRRR